MAMTRILVIEDDADLRGVLRDLLELDGFEVDEAENGEVGYRKYLGRRSEVVLTDIVMPEREGVETIMSLRRADPKVKIIAMSGVDGKADFLSHAIKLGAQRSLTKPFQHADLVAAIQAVLTED